MKPNHRNRRNPIAKALHSLRLVDSFFQAFPKNLTLSE